MKNICVFIVIFVISHGVKSQRCTTPLGKRSQCIPLNNCPELLSTFQGRQKLSSLSSELVDFLRESNCGFERSMPKVCCGPLPSYISTQNSNQQPPKPVPVLEQNAGNVDRVSYEDSILTPRGQCGIDTNGNRILGGNATDLDEYPWMTLLGYRTSKGIIKYDCGGSLINPRYILTAAHCLVGAIEVQVGKLVTARLGEYNTQTDIDCVDDECADPPQDIPVQATFAHPGYSDARLSRVDDIGLVRLARRARFSYFVQPICLVNTNSPRLYTGDDVVVAGWGRTLNGQKSPIKQKLRLPIFDKNSCLSRYRTQQVNLEYTQICAGGRRAEDSCRGDSGGSLMRMLNNGVWESIGIVSFGFGCGKEGWPGVYTAVAGYMDWIQNTLKYSNNN